MDVQGELANLMRELLGDKLTPQEWIQLVQAIEEFGDQEYERGVITERVWGSPDSDYPFEY